MMCKPYKAAVAAAPRPALAVIRSWDVRERARRQGLHAFVEIGLVSHAHIRFPLAASGADCIASRPRHWDACLQNQRRRRWETPPAKDQSKDRRSLAGRYASC
ncbi:hypothetical protein F441_07372 [Phytophthora nicotianae CJ01A1]|uniref:Uncharacterized protein n=3 Tax=Phytophthora nicotianae TaxID=4792 RepID=W2X6H3_PHYNI|nr:hypothetical protein L916_07174 [Phytophthora nicotianae]ETO77387.1 hypothetical protein F444_07429 [Phytophthora nicotianae P1976]ETP18435.1 hypothetical protein F441_07372 [Phytophthora nicotianae CJ01A1]